MKVGDLVRIDYVGWNVSYDLWNKEIHGVIVDLLTEGKSKCLTLMTTDGEEKIFSCNKGQPPNVVVVESHE